MNKLENIIKGLECCFNGKCGKCPYDKDSNCTGCEVIVNDVVLMDVLEFMKLQIPRVLTLEEIDQMVEPAHIIIAETRDDSGSDLNYGMLVEDRYEMDEGSILLPAILKTNFFAQSMVNIFDFGILNPQENKWRP